VTVMDATTRPANSGEPTNTAHVEYCISARQLGVDLISEAMRAW
jgi:hypothetical protein